MKARFFRLPIVATLFTLLGLFGVTALFAQDFSDLFILSRDLTSTDDGIVTLDFVVREGVGYGVPGLTEDSIRLSEDVFNVTLISEPRLSLALAVIVDLSTGSDVELVKDTLRSYMNYYYREGDEVTFYVLDGSNRNPRVVEITTLEDGNSLIDSLGQTGNFYYVETALDEALVDLTALGDVPSRPRIALYVGSFLTAPRERTLSTAFAEEGIPFHVVQAHRGRPVDDYRALALNGGGIFVNNRDGAFVLAPSNYEPVNILKVLFDTMDHSRLVYTLTYQTRNASLENFRNVELTVVLPSDAQLTASFSYNWSFQAPSVAFIDDSDLEPIRRPFRPNQDRTLAFDVDSQSVTVRIGFPDGVRRQIESVQYEVIETESGQVQQSTIELSPQLDALGNVILDWSLNEFSSPDTVIPVEVSVTVVDELGLVGTASQAGRVTVAEAPILPTPVPTATPPVQPESMTNLRPGEVPEGASGLAVIAIGNDGQPIIVNGQPLFLNPPRSLSTRTLIILIAVIAVLIGVMVLTVSRLLRIWRLARDQVLVKAETHKGKTEAGSVTGYDQVPVVSESFARPYVYEEGEFASLRGENANDEFKTTGPAIAESDPNEGIYARFVVKIGYDEITNLESRVIEVRDEEFLIGRDVSADWVLKLPYISPQHTRFSFVKSEVMVRDMGSKNGTYINGERILSGRDVVVPIGSEVSITRNIVLEIWDSETELDYDALLVEAGENPEDLARRRGEVVFKPLPGLQYIGDDSNISDDYSPI